MAEYRCRMKSTFKTYVGISDSTGPSANELGRTRMKNACDLATPNAILGPEVRTMHHGRRHAEIEKPKGSTETRNRQKANLGTRIYGLSLERNPACLV